MCIRDSFWTQKTHYNETYETPNMERLAKKGMAIMNKLLRGFFTASAAVFLCSGCKGIPPENEDTFLDTENTL